MVLAISSALSLWITRVITTSALRLYKYLPSIDLEADCICYISYIINLVVKALLFGEGVSVWEKKLIKALEEARVAL